jgi:hypothetical protein
LDFNICTVLHPHETCVQHFFTFAWAGFKRALPLYAPLHIVTTLVVLLAKLTSKVKESVKRAGSFSNLSRSFSIDDFIEATDAQQQTHDGEHVAVPAQPPARKEPLQAALDKAQAFAARMLKVLTKRRILRVTSFTLGLVRRVIFNIVRSSVFLGVYCSGTAPSAHSQHSLKLAPSHCPSPTWDMAWWYSCLAGRVLCAQYERSQGSVLGPAPPHVLRPGLSPRGMTIPALSCSSRGLEAHALSR